MLQLASLPLKGSSLVQTGGKQTVAVLLCAAYSVVATLIILKVGRAALCQRPLRELRFEAISLFMPLKPPTLHVDLHEPLGRLKRYALAIQRPKCRDYHCHVEVYLRYIRLHDRNMGP